MGKAWNNAPWPKWKHPLSPFHRTLEPDLFEHTRYLKHGAKVSPRKFSVTWRQCLATGQNLLFAFTGIKLFSISSRYSGWLRKVAQHGMLALVFQYFDHVTKRIVNVNRGSAISMDIQISIRLCVGAFDGDVRWVLPLEYQRQIYIAEFEHRPGSVLVDCLNLKLTAIPMQSLLDIRHRDSDMVHDRQYHAESLY